MKNIKEVTAVAVCSCCSVGCACRTWQQRLIQHLGAHCLWGLHTLLTARHASHIQAYAKPYSSRFVTNGIITTLLKDKSSEVKIPGDALHTKKSPLRAWYPELQKKYLEEGTTEHIQKQRYSAKHFLGTGYGPVMNKGIAEMDPLFDPVQLFTCTSAVGSTSTASVQDITIANPYVNSLHPPEAFLTVLSPYNFNRTLA